MLNNKLIDFLCGYPKEEVRITVWENSEIQYIHNKTNELISECEYKGLIQTLWEKFGGGLDSADRYVIMHPVKPIELASVYQDTIDEIVRRLHEKNLSEKNIR